MHAMIQNFCMKNYQDVWKPTAPKFFRMRKTMLCWQLKRWRLYWKVSANSFLPKYYFGCSITKIWCRLTDVEYVQQLQLENSYSRSHFQDSDFTKSMQRLSTRWWELLVQQGMPIFTKPNFAQRCLQDLHNVQVQQNTKKWQCNKKPARNTRSDGENKIVID